MYNGLDMMQPLSYDPGNQYMDSSYYSQMPTFVRQPVSLLFRFLDPSSLRTQILIFTQTSARLPSLYPIAIFTH